MEAAINYGLCRCCASEGSFKDLEKTYDWLGTEEVYANMLKDCFDISLSKQDSFNNGGICEVCITQLRNASNFKKQVQQTEQQFLKKIEDNGYQTSIIKVEVARPDDDDHDLFDDGNLSDGFSSPEYDIPLTKIKVEKLNETKPKKRAAKPSTSKAKKLKKEAGEPSAKRLTGAVSEWHWEPSGLSETVNDVLVEKHLPEMRKQCHNLMTLLKYSNATPFKDRNDAGYVCAYCFKTYPDCDVLRSHTHVQHENEKRTYKAGSGVSSFVVFLDIVDLKCTICDKSIDSISELARHLVEEHDKKYHMGVTDYFQPFKLTNDPQMNCCLCGEIFHNMKLLMQHMNLHYRNFICTICGAGFVNSFRLKRHEMTHGKKKSSYPCKQCGLVFEAESKKKAHVNTEHKGIAGDSVCQICKARFKNYYQKTRHMTQVHNLEGIKCDYCDKKFNLKSNLILHMRSVHLKERPYQCSVCSMGFFVKRHMLGHYMATHTNERKFKCEVCGKAYATQNSRRKHMKKNHGITKSTLMVQNLEK
ncbi:zinc finger protein 816-like isoform X4 [Aricia agestis]|uniref:zinc finger protein 816-like isoform X4 n=1 Tax=Aricia agestis TaxID=91739 RepID=UPI001C2071EF|nr:zinc finger protein 816-like isoform X4 [Aricia agestis]